jgi:ribosomal protein S18 acetylase RimI-like enzyme
MVEPIIRSAAREDFPAVVRMIQDLAAHVDPEVIPKTNVEILEHEGPFGKGRFKILVAETEGKIAGFCLYTYAFSGWRGATGLFIEDLYVQASARKMGLGKKLLAAAARAERGNASFIKLEVDMSDPAAMRFYQGLGMTLFEGKGIMLLGSHETKTLADS